jgi:hypothetical protein
MSPVSSTDNFSERNGLTGEFGANGPAQERPFVEDANLGHVPSGQSGGSPFPQHMPPTRTLAGEWVSAADARFAGTVDIGRSVGGYSVDIWLTNLPIRVVWQSFWCQIGAVLVLFDSHMVTMCKFVLAGEFKSRSGRIYSFAQQGIYLAAERFTGQQLQSQSAK